MNMKNIIFLFIGSMIFSSGCTDLNVLPVPLSEAEQLVIDLELIDNWIAENGIQDVQIHSSKIRYTINEIGAGTIAPKLSDIVKVNYEGRFLDTGTKFDGNPSLDFILSQTIPGWQIMVQEMKEGDSFTIYLPSAYGYGNRGSGPGGIPPNTVIVFDIKLLKIGL
jgi:FKBP-type peptidyl-prolyl cis-trans isomerase FkpA